MAPEKNLKATMKKENVGTDKKASSRRPSSVKVGGSGTISNNSALSKTKQQLEDVLKEKEELDNNFRVLKGNHDRLHENFKTLASKIITDAKSKGFELKKDYNDISCFDIPLDCIVDLLNSLAYKQEVVKKRKRGSVEARVEELETRITHLNMELAKLINLRLTLEHGLEDIQESNSLDFMKEKARFLLFETQGSVLSTYIAPEQSESSDSDKEISTSEINDTGILPETYSVDTIIKDLQTFQLNPPNRKMPGDTHIKRMDEDLKKYIVCELSLYKGNGADWRLMAERFGISKETVQQWQRWKLEYPMASVLETWSQSSAATVRMLHRHLVSSQMKAILLAKRISDFYSVD